MISVIVPIYNVEKYLHKCIDSILRQTFHDIEIILVDDGSTDNSSTICDEYKNMDDRIKVIHKENGGLVSAWKAGLFIASGKYVGFVDSDDYITRDMYENLYNAMVTDGSDLVICNVYDEFNEEISEQDNFLKSGCYSGEQLLDIKAKLLPSTICEGNILKFYRVNKLFLTDKLNEVVHYVDERISSWEDMVTTLPYILNCNSISIIDKPGYYYVQRDTSIIHSRKFENKLFSYMLAIDTIKKEVDDLGWKEEFNIDYLLETTIIALADAVDDFKTSKSNYRKLRDEIIKNKIVFNCPYLTKIQKCKAFLIKHKMYLLVYVLLRINAKRKCD